MRHLLEEAEEELDRFARAPRALLVFDFDGSLAPLAPTPGAARIHPAAAAALARLMIAPAPRMPIGVASGRRIEDLRRLLPPLDFWIGLHGLELAFGAEPCRLRFEPTLSDRALDRLRPRLRDAVRHGGRIEDKQHSIALHVRGVDPHAAAAAIAAFEDLVEAERAAGAPLECMRGHLVIEARPTAAGKHRAVAEVLDHIGEAALAFIGDDTTDEEVFRAFPNALTVVVMEPVRATDARYRLRSPVEAALFLERLAALRSRT